MYWVNNVTQNLVVEDTDFSYAGLGPALDFKRTYNSDPSISGMFGKGWAFAYESTVSSHCGGAGLADGSGRRLLYTGDLCPAYGQSLVFPLSLTPPAGTFDSLTLLADGTWERREKKTGFTYRYSHPGGACATLACTDPARLTSIEDPNGNAVTITHNDAGQMRRIRDAAGRSTFFSHDANNRCVLMTVPDGRTARYRYDDGGRLIQTTDLLGNVVNYAYDDQNAMTRMAVGDNVTKFDYTVPESASASVGASSSTGLSARLTGVTDARGGTMTFEHASDTQVATTSAKGEVSNFFDDGLHTTGTTSPLGFSDGYAYTDGLVTTYTDLNGNSHGFEYDGSGNMTRWVDASGAIREFTYDASSNLTAVTQPDGASWTFVYDAKNNLAEVGSPLGTSTRFTRDAKGQPATIARPSGAEYGLEWDSTGKLASIRDPLGYQVTQRFDDQGINLTSKTDAGGNTTSFGYDANGRVTTITHADGKAVTASYTGLALDSLTDENGKTVTFTRDGLLNVTAITDPLGNAWLRTFDKNGNRASKTDPLGNKTTYAYDADDRLTRITMPTGEAVKFTFNNNGKVLSLTDGKQHKTTFTYDASDRLLTTTDPLGRAVTLTRNGQGKVVSKTNARGEVVEYEYDAAGKLASRKMTGETVTFTRDANGNAASMVDKAGRSRFTYNKREELTRMVAPDGGVFSFTYNGAGKETALVYPDGFRVDTRHDTRNRPKSVKWTGGGQMGFTCDGAGNLVGETRSNGTSTSYRYNGLNQVVSIDHKKGTDSFAAFTYTRNKSGAVLTEKNSAFDAFGISGATRTAQFDAADQMRSTDNRTCTYDKDGNLATAHGDLEITAAHDSLNRVKSLTVAGVTRKFTHNGFGYRTKVVDAGGVATTYHHDFAGRLLMKSRAGESAPTHYIYWKKALVAMEQGGVVRFFHHDQRGDVVAVTDGAGAVVARYLHGPSGEILKRQGSVANEFTFLGRHGVMDEGNGLFFMRNRYYDSSVGRFLEKDPVGVWGGTANLYAYGKNDPVNRVDPYGTRTTDEYLDAREKYTSAHGRSYQIPEKVATPVFWVADKAANMMDDAFFSFWYPLMKTGCYLKSGEYAKATYEVLKMGAGAMWGPWAGLGLDLAGDVAEWSGEIYNAGEEYINSLPVQQEPWESGADPSTYLH